MATKGVIQQESVVTMSAISHCYWADRPEELLEEAMGAQLLLVREVGNIDPNAVRVHFRGEVAGYVCGQDAPKVAAALDKASRVSALGRVTGTITEPYYKLRIACNLDIRAAGGTDVEQNRPYLDWQYTGPVMPLSPEAKRLQGAVEYLEYVLTGVVAWDEYARDYFRTFMAFHRQDYSDEMFHFRAALLRFMTENEPEAATALEGELHEMSRHEYFDSIGEYVANLPNSTEFREMAVRERAPDKDVLCQELQAFPGNMLDLFLRDRNTFARRLHYIHPPREPMRRLFSGMAWLLQYSKMNGWAVAPTAAGPSSGGLPADHAEINVNSSGNFFAKEINYGRKE